MDLLLATILAFVAGGINSVGFLAYGYFSANMTGNVSLVSELLSDWKLRAAAAFFTIVLMFITGAFLASLFIQMGKRHRLKTVYALTLGFEGAILMLVGIYVSVLPDTVNGFTIVSLLALSMGIQNAASTRISGARVRTTHVSGLATDIGVGLALLWGAKEDVQRDEIATRLRLHAATILAFAVGGVVGALMYTSFQGLAFCLLATLLFALCAIYSSGIVAAD
ncbi:YoaK family protein [Shinella oryzae]|uniref:YoaK family protein n=1 Tax=Shinella oryzae TaxID=2871820 RepID=A0ABY9KAF5_9HYPH|nr:YoaK family protein [Shinella oryzae]WLS05456.1 YoaK family protein [Shinella oryzae]